MDTIFKQSFLVILTFTDLNDDDSFPSNTKEPIYVTASNETKAIMAAIKHSIYIPREGFYLRSTSIELDHPPQIIKA